MVTGAPQRDALLVHAVSEVGVSPSGELYLLERGNRDDHAAAWRTWVGVVDQPIALVMAAYDPVRCRSGAVYVGLNERSICI